MTRAAISPLVAMSTRRNPWPRPLRSRGLDPDQRRALGHRLAIAGEGSARPGRASRRAPSSSASWSPRWRPPCPRRPGIPPRRSPRQATGPTARSTWSTSRQLRIHRALSGRRRVSLAGERAKGAIGAHRAGQRRVHPVAEHDRCANDHALSGRRRVRSARQHATCAFYLPGNGAGPHSPGSRPLITARCAPRAHDGGNAVDNSKRRGRSPESCS